MNVTQVTNRSIEQFYKRILAIQQIATVNRFSLIFGKTFGHTINFRIEYNNVLTFQSVFGFLSTLRLCAKQSFLKGYIPLWCDPLQESPFLLKKKKKHFPPPTFISTFSTVKISIHLLFVAVCLLLTWNRPFAPIHLFTKPNNNGNSKKKMKENPPGSRCCRCQKIMIETGGASGRACLAPRSAYWMPSRRWPRQNAAAKHGRRKKYGYRFRHPKPAVHLTINKTKPKFNHYLHRRHRL